MCGLTGFWDSRAERDGGSLEAIVDRMAWMLKERGPDDGGAWVDPEVGVALGHRRLAIVDLSPLGHQPMVSRSGGSVLAYNGEIYNFSELREALVREGSTFKSASDTEVLLEALEHWGPAVTLPRLIGMFAFAWWDRRNRSLTLARDRLGIKPLYWGRQGPLLFFGSQPKSFFPHPDWRPEIDRTAMAGCLAYSYVPTPRSIYRGIAKLTPGEFVVIPFDGAEHRKRYWDLATVISTGAEARRNEPVVDQVAALDALLRDAVGRRMVADVPLGAFLSGGVDSSVVVALMQAQSMRPVKTFSIGFHERNHNEAPFAKAVAAHLGTDHTELYAEPAHALALVPKIPDYYDEPFSDSSQLPTWLVSELTRREVTVSLSGDGGDELFAGYTRYMMAARLESLFKRLPYSVRRVAAGLLRTPSPRLWDGLLSIIPASRRPTLIGDKLHKLAAILARPSREEIYPQLVSFWPLEAELVPGEGPAPPLLREGQSLGLISDETERMQALDILTYLPDDILAKVDRASMAVSLEARVPLLDHRVVEFAWGIPGSLKIRQGLSKWLLRQVLYQYVPPALIERPKMGFGVPIDSWLRGPLRDWAEDLLDERRLREDGLFHVEPIRRRWDEHLSGSRNWQYALWGVLMAQAWKRRWMEGNMVS